MRSAISPSTSAGMTSTPTLGLPTATIASPRWVFPSLSSYSFAKPIAVTPAPVCVVNTLSVELHRWALKFYLAYALKRKRPF
ncbi:MAG: hypothetical protein QXD70_00255 [Candidatus Bathyarchaeia archaeon]